MTIVSEGAVVDILFGYPGEEQPVTVHVESVGRSTWIGIRFIGDPAGEEFGPGDRTMVPASSIVEEV